MAALREMSAQTGQSIAELTRRAVDSYIKQNRGISREERIRRAMSVAGKYHSGLHDVGENHDKYLDEIYGEW